MALPVQVVALLLSEHAREPFAGPVLTYGRQELNFSYEAALWMFESLGLAPDPAGMIDPPGGPTLDFGRLVKLLGLGELQTLDAAELNGPVPSELIGRFGLIVDGGAMEHVFDLRQGMQNTAELLRTGGRVVHVSPVNNHVNRGFVQLSPTFYHDYYSENSFTGVRGSMLVQPRSNRLGRRWNVFQYDHAQLGGVNSMFCPEETQLGMYFTARKTPDSTSARVPVQSYFTRVYDGMDVLPGQYVVTHDAAQHNARQIRDPEPRAGAVVLFTPIWSLRGSGGQAG